MPGVDGAVKFNNKVIAPKSKTTETNLSVSEFNLPIKTPSNQSKNLDTIEEKTEISAPVIAEAEIHTPIDVAPKKEDYIEIFDVKKEFDKATTVIKKTYDKVFSKSRGFKPEFGETVGDMILYLSGKLKKINASVDFDKAFGLLNYNLPQKYFNNYIPLAIKLAVWCKSKGVLDVCDELLFELSSVYIKSAKNVGVIVSEEDIEKAFSLEINEVFNK